jgi:DNA polymerase-3 subunit delta'
MQLKDIFCQDNAIESLQRAYASGRMAHAYLFSGDDGVGKFTLARAWAKMLLCENKQACHENPAFVDSCGQCHSCQMFEGDGHPDYRPLFKELIRYTKEGKNKTTPVKFPIDVIREFLIEKVANKPAVGKFVVYVIDEAEKVSDEVSDEAQNAMLKVLEEPPNYCVIILLCSRLDAMLPTTLSRCQLVRFGPVDQDRIVAQLAAAGVNENEAVYWARFAQGSVGRAMAWSQLEVEPDGVYSIKKELIEKIASLQLPDAVNTADWMGKAAKKIASAWSSSSGDVSTTDINRRSQKGLIQMIACLYGDVMKLNAGVDCPDTLVNHDQFPCVRTMAQHVDAETAAEYVQFCYRMNHWIDSSVNEKLIFEQLTLNLNSYGNKS